MKKKKKRTGLYIGIAVVVLLLMIAIAKMNGGDEGRKVAVETAAPHTILETVTASGKIYPETEVKISPEVSGEITMLNIQEGDSVRAGQLLVKINPAIYSSIVNQAQASVQQSQAGVTGTRGLMEQSESQYDLAKATWERNQTLYKNKVISQLEFEQATANYKGAKAAFESAKANISSGQYGVQSASASLNQARENLRKTTIIAPVSGIISQLAVKQGERVVGTAQMAGTEMLTIADMSRMEVRVDVSETDIAKVKPGDTARIDADAYRDRRFTGIVSKVGVSSKGGNALQSTDQVTNYTVHIYILPESYADIALKLAARSFVFKPGMSASVEIQTRRVDNVLSVPVNAVTTRDWPDSLQKQKAGDQSVAGAVRQVVFLLDGATGTVRLQDVSTGIQDNTYIYVTSGLKADQTVITAPYGAVARDLKDGDKVQVVPKDKLFEGAKEED